MIQRCIGQGRIPAESSLSLPPPCTPFLLYYRSKRTGTTGTAHGSGHSRLALRADFQV